MGPLSASTPHGELLADLVDRAEKMRANRASPKPEMFGNIFEREVFVMAQTEDDFLLRGERSFSAFNGLAQLRRHQLPFRIGTIVDGFDRELIPLVILSGKETDEFPAPQPVPRTVDGDPREPGLELRATFEAAEVRVSLNERVLGYGIRFGLVSDDGVSDAKDLSLK